MFQKKAVEQDKKAKGSRSVHKEKKGGDVKASPKSTAEVPRKQGPLLLYPLHSTAVESGPQSFVLHLALRGVF